MKRALSVPVLAVLVIVSSAGAAPPPARLSLPDAEELVTSYMFEIYPGMNASEEFQLREITSDEIWDHLRLQVFKVTEGFHGTSTYVIAGDEVVAIGVCFGGGGAKSIVVDDIDQDGSKELLYTYSCGSGMRFSTVGALLRARWGWDHASADFSYDGDLVLKREGDDGATLHAAEWESYAEPWREEQNSDNLAMEKLGTLALNSTAGEPRLEVNLREALSPAILEKVLDFSGGE